jgi:hypothetical protein
MDMDIECSKNNITYLRSNKTNDPWQDSCVQLVPDEILKPENFNFYHPFLFNRLHFDTLDSWKRMREIMGKETKFVLNIDLYFFVCNGKELTKKQYQKEFEDIRSPYRTTGLPEINTPRQQYDTVTGRKFQKKLSKESNEIKKRVNRFLRGLAYLKKEKRMPSVINLSDSTPSLFSGDINRAVFNNNYTPKYFVPYIHLLLISGLHELYGNGFISMFN